MPKPTTLTLEHLPKDLAAKLDEHEKKIRSYLRAEAKGIGEFLGYKYLLGREMLLAKEAVPHGNSDHSGKADSANQGFKSWLQARFPRLCYRSCANRMELTRLIHEHPDGSPLTEINGRITVKARATIERVMSLVLDGKSATRFMRDAKVLRDLQKPKPVPRKKLDPNQLLTAKQKQAARLWTGIISDVSLGLKLRQHLNDQLRADILDCLVAASTQFRQDKSPAAKK